MSTQKAKFELFSRLQALGFTYDESAALRRIEMTLHRWDESECGDSNAFSSWCVERDEATNKPFRYVYPHNGPMRRYPIADREAGAKRRLAQIVMNRNLRLEPRIGDAHPEFIRAYHQSDCRGAALYLVRARDIPAGTSIDSCYNRGLCVAA